MQVFLTEVGVVVRAVGVPSRGNFALFCSNCASMRSISSPIARWKVRSQRRVEADLVAGEVLLFIESAIAKSALMYEDLEILQQLSFTAILILLSSMATPKSSVLDRDRVVIQRRMK